MRATAETIWQVPAYLPYLQPPLTERSLARAEKKLGFKLPDEFVNLLRKQNGGYIRYSLPKMVHDSIAGIGPHFPSLTEFDWDECQEDVSFMLNGLVPFDGDGHWHLCLDYRQQTANPSVAYVDIECDRHSQVANSFSSYLTKLRIDKEDEYVLESVHDIETVKALISKTLRTQFDATDSWAHGYPVHRARLGEASDPEWLWLSPNTVPRGFVRPDDMRYSELKDLLPGVAPRFPEIPPESYLVSATEKVRSQVLDSFDRSGLALRLLQDYLKEG